MTDGQFDPPTNVPLPPPNGRPNQIPPWLLPASIGGVVVLLVVGLVVLFTRGGDDDAAPVDSSPTTLPVVTEPPATEPPPTEPPVTEPPVTEPPATEPPVTDATTTTTTEPSTPDLPTAAPLSDLSEGLASIATAQNTQTYDVRVVCPATVAPGLQVVSALLIGQDATSIYVVDIFNDEGSDAVIEITEMDGIIEAAAFGRDGADLGPLRWSGSGSADPLEPIDRRTFDSIGVDTRLDGTPTGPLNLSINLGPLGDCASGFLAANSPFAPGTQVEIRDQFDIDINGSGFAVLADCAGGRLVGGGGYLLGIVVDSVGSADLTISAGLEVDSWRSPFDPAPTDFVVDAAGGGGDVTYGFNVESFLTGQRGYLQWTDRPTVEGGLEPDVCTAF